MKTFTIPCSWEVYGYLEIDAETLQEALDLAEDDSTGLPRASNYVDGSFKVDAEVAEEDNE